MIIALVLLIVSFLGPWYLVNANGVLGGDYRMEMFLSHLDFEGRFGNQEISMSMDYETAKTKAQSTDVNVESFTTIETVMYMMLPTILIVFISACCLAAFVFKIGAPKMMKMIGGLFAVLTFLLIVIPALYFMSTDYVKNSGGFWFSYSGLGMTISGGPGYAWYLAIAAAIISVICTGAILVKKNQDSN